MTMKSFDTDILKYTHKTRLKASEREALRARILAYMEYHPRKEGSVKLEETHTRGILFAPKQLFARALALNTLYTRIGAGVFAVLLIAVVPFAAENAAPGDVLYPFKTQINETVLAQFNNSPYQKVAFETELMERRIAEARLLAKEGKLSEETEAALALSVQNHANAVQEGIDTLKESDVESAAIAEITFGSVLDVQSAVLDSGTGSTPGSTDGIAVAVRAAKSVIDEQRGTTTPSYERLMAHVEGETTRAYALLDAIKGSATEEEKKDIGRRLSDIERKIASAQEIHANLAVADEEDAAGTGEISLMMSAKVAPVSDTAELGMTLGDINKLIAFMTDIDVRNSVTLETLVPVTLTPEEAAFKALDDVVVRYAALEKKIDTATDAPLLEAIESARTDLETLLDMAIAAREAGNSVDVEVMLLELTLGIENLEVLLIESEVEGVSTSIEETIE